MPRIDQSTARFPFSRSGCSTNGPDTPCTPSTLKMRCVLRRIFHDLMLVRLQTGEIIHRRILRRIRAIDESTHAESGAQCELGVSLFLAYRCDVNCDGEPFANVTVVPVSS